MTGGKVMLLATIISAAFAANATVEARQLSMSSSEICEPYKVSKTAAEIDLVNKALGAKYTEMMHIVGDVKAYYFQISQAPEQIEESQYDHLRSLATGFCGITEHMKTVMVSERQSIIDCYGQDTFELFRRVVAMHGQMKRNILNVLAIYDAHFGNTTELNEPSLAMTGEFWSVAMGATARAYGQH